MDDPAVGFGVLKMEKPPFARRRVDQRTLMRTVDVSGALRQDDAVFERPRDPPGTEDRLPSLLDAAGGRKDVIQPFRLYSFGPSSVLYPGMVSPLMTTLPVSVTVVPSSSHSGHGSDEPLPALKRRGPVTRHEDRPLS